MSKEYIERGALLEDIGESVVFSVRNAPGAEMRGANKIVERIQCAHAADVVEVKHGRWEYRGFLYGHNCSCCGVLNTVDTNYCPNCGAKMDGERHEFLRIGRCNHCGYTKQKTSKYQQGVGWSYCPTCKGLCVKWETVGGGADNG